MATAMLVRKEDYAGGVIREDNESQKPSVAREVYEMVCVTEGTAEYWIEDQHYKLTGGDILLIPTGVMVSTNLKQRGCPFSCISVWISRRFMNLLKQQDDTADHAFGQVAVSSRYLLRLPEEDFADIREDFETVASECLAENISYEMSCKALLAALFVRINRMVHTSGDTVLVGGDNNRLAPVLTYIHANCTEALAVEKLAESFDYSPSHLAHSFKKHMGTSLYHYVLLRRLQIGREAMLSGVPVKEAYQRCGFGDYAGFYRAFMKEYGMSPQQYKKAYQMAS